VVIRLSQLSDKVNTASSLLNGLLEESAPKDIKQLNSLLDQLIKSSGFLPQLVPILKELKRSPDSFMKFVNREPLNTQALEATIAYGDLLKAYSKQRDIDSTDAYAIRAAVDKLKELHKSWMRCNARLILARQHDNFKKNIKRADESSAGQSAAEKTWKRNYTDGRKILENEFGKQMRYKAIRELAMGNSGQLIKDLKPVWLMSPLSVSDTLPVDSSFFDVVIFDEASQITLEEGIPPVFRAAQSIIVGDEMQMPPSNFFGTATHDPEDIFDENDDSNVVLDAESLLTQAGRKLPDVMLGWHYRSRYENLISFSNNAFYKAGLLTIPDKTALRKNLNEITVAKADDAATNTTYLMDRSISYHHYPTAVYDQRTNSGEAAYIAYMVLSLLRQNCKDSIGVVAFSQEQQLEIENAIEALAEEWKMNAQLEEAYQRTEDDQFVGLFVKNLENVQGDERDIIIMSICYGYDANKKIIMNFGPINRKGGEKRLNVIFSRAKKHIAVVSSIRHTDITNEYNEGANYFRKFLQYATMVSSGRNEDAAAILHSMSNKTNERIIAKNIVVDEIAAQLRAAGFTTDKDLGQSYFKCQLGVRKKADAEQYDLGILVDGDEPATDVMEKYFQRPQTMQAFGWNVIQVWTKDWFHKKEDVMKQIIAALDKKQE
jgi:superfamily I DNA and/or RNA helicase